MGTEITDISGNTRKTICLSCSIVQSQVELRGGSVIRSKYFDVHQDFEIPIPGFMILTSLKHLMSVDEFNEEEQQDFIKVLSSTRKLQREVLGINVVYLHQEEDTSHHFHLWIFPRYEWMKEWGRKSESMRPIMEHARANMKTDENLKQLDEAVVKLRVAANKLGFSN